MSGFAGTALVTCCALPFYVSVRMWRSIWPEPAFVPPDDNDEWLAGLP